MNDENIAKMEVVEMKYSVLRNYFNGCVQHIKEEKKEGTWVEGQSLGIDDALKVVEEKDLTFIMQRAIKGLRHTHDDSTGMGDFFTKSDAHLYFCGYKSGINEALKIITGETFDK
jgi:hypothetical protein